MDEMIIVTIARSYATTPRASWSQGSSIYLSGLETVLPERSSYYLIAGAESHVDATIALPTSVSRFAALRLLLAEGAGLDLIARNGLNQRVTNGVDTTFAQTLIVLVGDARIRVAADTHIHGRILLNVRR